MSYDVGDLVRISGSFTDAAGAAVDPDVVKCSYRSPGGTTTTLTYGVGLLIVKDSAGHYHVDVNADAAGTWRYRFWSTGNGQAAGETSFHVRVGEI